MPLLVLDNATKLIYNIYVKIRKKNLYKVKELKSCKLGTQLI